MNIDFKNYLTREEFDNTEYLGDNFDKLLGKIKDFLIDLRDNNILKISKDFDDHNNYELLSWIYFINKKLDIKNEDNNKLLTYGNTYFYRFEEMLSGSAIYSLYNLSRNKTETDELKKISLYNELVKDMNEGNFAFGFYECQDCGQKLRIECKNWDLQLKSIELKQDINSKIGLKREIVNVKPCLPKENINLEVEFKTGNLLIADWFRINEFTEFFKNQISINNKQGQLDSTKFHLEKGNVLTLHVGNSSPSIFQKNNELFFGYEKEDVTEIDNEIKEKGYVCTDLWNVTILEKENLIELLNKQNVKNAKKFVSDYLKENDIVEIKIEPGIYNCKFNLFKNLNKSGSQEEKEEIPTHIETRFSLKKQELKLENKKKIRP